MMYALLMVKLLLSDGEKITWYDLRYIFLRCFSFPEEGV